MKYIITSNKLLTNVIYKSGKFLFAKLGETTKIIKYEAEIFKKKSENLDFIACDLNNFI